MAVDLGSNGNTPLLLYVGLLLLASQAGGRLAVAARVPRVTGYLVAGIFIGPAVIGLIPERVVESDLGLITEIALAIIAFSIGGSLKFSRLRGLGKSIFFITIAQAAGAFCAVTFVLAAVLPLFTKGFEAPVSYWGEIFPAALIVGAVSAATAPAAVMGVVHEYRCRGPFTTVLLGVIALDDALTIFFFAVAMSVAAALTKSGALSADAVLIGPSLEILIAIAVGGAIGLILRFPMRFFHKSEVILGVILGAILTTAGLARWAGVSPLLANMMLGFVAVNFLVHEEEAFRTVESVEEPLFGIFFALAGAHMLTEGLGGVGLLAVAIVVARFSGKFAGTFWGAKISRAPKTVGRYLGLALLPKAGVTVGLILEAAARFDGMPIWRVLIGAVLASVILNELIAPLGTRYALFKSGEAVAMKKEVSE